jgi:chromosome segregation ATPase
MDKAEAYKEKWEAQLKELQAKIDGLAAKAAKAKAEAKIELSEGLEGLKAKRDEVRDKLGKLREAGESASEDLRRGAESALFDLKTAVESAVEKFK